MAKLYACSASIHVAPSGSGLPSTCSHVGRFVDGVAAGAAAAPGAGRFVESLMLPLSDNSACRLSQSRTDPHRTLPSIPPALYPALHWLLQVSGEKQLAGNPRRINYLVLSVGGMAGRRRLLDHVSRSSPAKARYNCLDRQL